MLRQIIRQQIAQNGFITVADYMELCLLHPEHGYYTTRAVFGTQGDFITAPEISQLFGEIVGVWAMTEWERLGKPAACDLVEFGPGRGTLLRDLLRATAGHADFTAALRVHCVEASPKLQEQQQNALANFAGPKIWHAGVDTLPFDRPVIIVANEFFDALPVRQFVIQNRAWHERIIVLQDDRLAWSVSPVPADGRLLPATQYQSEGIMCEAGQPAADIFKTLCGKLKQARGAMLAVDYGDHTVNRYGETLQAVKDHDYSDVLADPGQADLTTHVDFYQLDRIALDMGLQTDFMVQADFLKQFGIAERLAALLQHDATVSQKNALLGGYQRLTDPAQMGHLFKALIVQTP